MRKSSEGFELENRGLHAVSERVGDLRGGGEGVRGPVRRARRREPGRRGGAGPGPRASTEQAGALSQELVRLSEEARRIAIMRENAEQLETLAGDTAERMQRIEVLKPQLDEAVRQLADPQGHA